MLCHHLKTEIEISTTPERVWSILTDFEAYPEWNPFIRSIRGVPEKGARLEAFMQPGGAGGMTFRPRVLVVEPGREFRWLGRLLLPGIFDGNHGFLIQPLAGGKVLFRQTEHFRGVLVPVFRGRLDRETRRGFEEMNLALKARAEAADASDEASGEAHPIDLGPKV
ncbi:MAG: SRPBCC family protein [Syntrophales bacterium]